MKKIAILSSGSGVAALEAAGLFNEGNRVRVPLYVTNAEIGQSDIDKFKILNIEVVEIDSDGFLIEGGSLVELLQQVGIDLIVMDNYTGLLPVDVSKAFADNIISIREGESIQRAVVRNLITEDRKAFDGIHSPATTIELPAGEIEDVSEDDQDLPLSVSEVTPGDIKDACDADNDKEESADEAWSKVLHMEFDKDKATQGAVPPPPINNRVQPAVYPHPYTQNQSNGVKMPPSYLLWSVLATVFCCLIPGIVGIFFSSQVSSRYFRGDYEGAEKASRNAQIWIIVSFVLGMISSTLYFPLMMVQ